MSDATAHRRGDQPRFGQLAGLAVAPVQQVRDWIMAHKLEACGTCIGFRIEELGLGEFVPVLRSRRDGLGPGC